MYELIWNFFYTTFLGCQNGDVFSDGISLFSNILMYQQSTTGRWALTGINIEWPLIAVTLSHVLTIVSLVMIFLAFVSLIKGLFKVVGGGFKW